MEANLENQIPTKRKLNSEDVVTLGFLIGLLAVMVAGVYLVGQDSLCGCADGALDPLEIETPKYSAIAPEAWIGDQLATNDQSNDEPVGWWSIKEPQTE